MGLAHPLWLGHPAKRCNALGGDRQADVIEPEGRGGLQLAGKRGSKLPAHRGGGHRVDQRLALGQSVVRAPWSFEHFLARKEPFSIGSQVRDEALARGELIEARAQPGSGRTGLGATDGREFEHAVGPGDETVPMQKASVGAHVGRHETRENGGRTCGRDAPTDRQEGLESRVRLVGTLASPRRRVCDVVDTRALQALFLQPGNGFLPRTATVFAVGSWATHRRHEALEHLGNRGARPGRCSTAPDAVDTLEREGPGSALMVMGLTGQDGPHVPRAQAHAASEHPDEAMGKGGLAEGEAPQGAGRWDAHDREPDHPMDDGGRAWCFLDAKHPREETQDARDGTKADVSDEKEWESPGDDVDLRHGGEALQLGLELTQAGLGRFEGCGDPVSLNLDARVLLALVALALASLLRLVFPLISTGLQCGQLAHHLGSGSLLWPEAMEGSAGWTEEEPRAYNDSVGDAPLPPHLRAV